MALIDQLTSQIPEGVTLDAATGVVAKILLDANVAFGQGVNNAGDEAVWLVLSACGHPLDTDCADWSQPLSGTQRNSLVKLLDKRVSSRIPLAYLLGETWFAGLQFWVDQRVLIPRSYISEWISEGFAPWVNPLKVDSILDLCCGNGCIGIATAAYLQNTSLVLSDMSAAALEVAARNVSRHELGHRTRINRGDMFEGIDRRFDLILCNPPYVSSDRMAGLPDEFRREPKMALHSGVDGLDFMRRFFTEVRDYLTDHGTMVVEVGSASDALEQAWPQMPFNWLATEYDETVLFAMSVEEFDASLSGFL